MFSRFQVAIITFISLTTMVFAPLVRAVPIAQDDDPDDTPAIVIEGPVQAINVNIITIADIDITVETANPILTTIQIGDVVQVEGNIDTTMDAPMVIATNVVITNTNIIAPVITITGPVQAINLNIVTVFNIDIQFNPNDLILDQLNIGDVISVGGNVITSGSTTIIIPIQVVIVVNANEPDPEATPESTPDRDVTPEPTDIPVTIVVEGPVEAINVNVITIFDIDIEIDPADPVLVDIEIGDNIRVEGNPTSRDDTIIIVAVNITIIDVDIIVIDNPGGGSNNPGLPAGCKVTKKGKIKCTKKSSKKS